mmetsp:Transcript_106738/g.166711  ORF Transcript_106738/g.166711 Transcript_106738/m.166711 type:complete len:152 (+) Transcript_106738:85-540(+)
MGQQASRAGQNVMATVGGANITESLTSQIAQTKDFGSAAVEGYDSQATLEKLVHAVEKMHLDHVKHLLHAGIDPNLPIDKEGHTVLDAYAKAHEHMLRQLLNSRYPKEQKTRIFFANQLVASHVFEELIHHGAKMSTPEMVKDRRRLQYVS